MQPRFITQVAPRILTPLLMVIAIVVGNVGFAYTAEPQQKVYYFLHDHLGGISAVTDEQGNVVERRDYLPYGEDRLIDEADVTDYGFTGKEKDPESELYYYGARYYDPVIGRFISQDPWEGDLTNPQTLNKYSYALNNPLFYVDPDGENPAAVIGFVAAFLATYFAGTQNVAAPAPGDPPVHTKAETEIAVDTVKAALENSAVVKSTLGLAKTGYELFRQFTGKTGTGIEYSQTVKGVPKNALERVIKRLQGMSDRQNKIGRIKAFGSRTKDQYNSQSDVDIYVEIFSDETGDSERFKEITNSIKRDFKNETGLNLDIAPFKWEDVGSGTKFQKSDLIDIQ